MKNILMIAVSGLFLCSCFSPEITGNNKSSYSTSFKFDYETFNAERKKWKEQNIEDYMFVSSSEFTSAGPFVLVVKTTVSGGSKSAQEVLPSKGYDFDFEEGDPRLNDPMKGRTSRFNTIPEFYRYIEKMVEDDKKSFDDGVYVDVSITVGYDKNYHYPKSVKNHCWYKSDSNLAGSGPVYLNITEFKVPPYKEIEPPKEDPPKT